MTDRQYCTSDIDAQADAFILALAAFVMFVIIGVLAIAGAVYWLIF